MSELDTLLTDEFVAFSQKVSEIHIEKKKMGKLDLMIEINPIQFHGSKSKLTINLLKIYGVKMTRFILKVIENPLSIIYHFKPPILTSLSGE